MSASAAALCPSYERKRPELTALHIVVREHLETFVATVREERGKDLPRYVEQERRRYIRCGIPAHGFLRVACRSCGHDVTELGRFQKASSGLAGRRRGA